ncbi:MAG: polysaccharide biosynthesis C-terminal domain-containing protein [Verrucomicrobiota bacterium]
MFGQETFGQYAFFQSLFGYILVFAVLGFDKLLIYKIAGDSKKSGGFNGGRLLRSLVSISVGAVVLTESVLIGAWWLLGNQFSTDAFWLFIFSINAIFAVVGTLFVAFFQANKRVEATISIAIFINIFKILVIVLMDQASEIDKIWLGAFILLPSLLNIVLFLYLFQKGQDSLENLDARQNEDLDRSDITYSLRLMLTKFTHTGVERIDLIMIGVLLTPIAVAEYAVAAKVAILVAAGNTMLSPLLSTRLRQIIQQGNEQELLSEYNKARVFSTLTAISVLVVLLVFGKSLLSLFGNYSETFPILVVLALAHFNRNAFGPNGRFLMFNGLSTATLVTTTTTLFLIVSLNIILIPSFGIMGAAFGTMMSIALVNICLQIYMAVKLGFRPLRLPDYLLILALNIISLLIIFNGHPVS